MDCWLLLKQRKSLKSRRCRFNLSERKHTHDRIQETSNDLIIGKSDTIINLTSGYTVVNVMIFSQGTLRSIYWTVMASLPKTTFQLLNYLYIQRSPNWLLNRLHPTTGRMWWTASSQIYTFVVLPWNKVYTLNWRAETTQKLKKK